MKRSLLTVVHIFFTMMVIAQWNPNTIQNLNVAGLSSADIQAAAGTNGSTWVAWYVQNGSNYDMHAQLFNSLGFKMLGPDGILVSNHVSGSATYVFNVTVDNGNNFIIAFQDQRNGSNGTVAYKVNPEGTEMWGVDGIVLGPGLSPYPAVLSTGEVLIAWNNSSNRISYQKISLAGTAVWGTALELLPITTGRTITRVQVVPHTAGTFGLVFQQRTGTIGNPISTNLFEQRFDNNGVKIWTTPVQLSNYVTASSRYYSVLSNADTTYVGYYGNPNLQNKFDAFLQRVNADGSLPWAINGSDFSTDPAPYEQNISIAYTPGSAVVWAVCTYSDINQNNYGIYIQKYNMLTGARIFGDNAQAVFAINSNNERQAGNLGLCSDQPIFMFYDATNKLFATRLDNNGIFAWVGNKVELGSTLNTKFRFNFTTSNTAQSVAVWQENRGASDSAYTQNISCSGGTGLIPVTLVNFMGMQNGKQVDLSWHTETESNNNGFFIERSGDGMNFISLGFINSKAPGGYSSSRISYESTDVNPLDGMNYYRLKQADRNGRYVYSNTILVRMSKAGFYLQRLYPEPVINDLNLLLGSKGSAFVSFIVTDLSGRILHQEARQMSAGNNEIHIKLSPLAAGVYFLRIVNQASGEVLVNSFIKG